MRKIESFQMEIIYAGGDRCVVYTWMLMGVGTALLTAGVTAPLGAVIGGVGAAAYFGGGCG